MKKLRIKKGWKMKCKAAKFTSIDAVGNYPIDTYPADEFIPDAILVANTKIIKAGLVDEDGKALTSHKEWTLVFMDAMDEILSEKGMRIL